MSVNCDGEKMKIEEKKSEENKGEERKLETKTYTLSYNGAEKEIIAFEGTPLENFNETVKAAFDIEQDHRVIFTNDKGAIIVFSTVLPDHYKLLVNCIASAHAIPKPMVKPCPINMPAPFPVKEKLVNLYVATPTGTTMTLNVSPNYTIRKVKQLIRDKEGISPSKQILISNDEILEDGMTLRSYGLESESTISLLSLEPKPETGGTISVKTPTGKMMKISVNLTDTIGQLKAKFQDIEGIPHDQQEIIYARMRLENGKILTDYAIQFGDVLHMVLRQKGC